MRNSVIAILASLLLATSGYSVAGGKSSSGSKSTNGASSKSANADYRSAKSGQYVTKGYADKNKDTTVKENRKK